MITKRPCWRGQSEKASRCLFHPFCFLPSLCLWRKSDSSSVCSARLSSRHPIIILSGARAGLIDAPLHCLPQAHDLTKTLSSSASFLSFSPLLKRDDFICRWGQFCFMAGGGGGGEKKAQWWGWYLFRKSVPGRKSECTCVFLQCCLRDLVCFTRGALVMAPAVCCPEKPPVSG